MQYTNPSTEAVQQAEAQIRQDYAQYGQATAHPAKITKEQAEQIAATLPDCEFREEGHGLFTFQRIGPRGR